MSDSLFSFAGMAVALSIGLLTGAEHRPVTAVGPTPDLQQPPPPGHTVQRSSDGLFYVQARINGAPILLAVDTGANLTVLRRADAQRAGLLSSRLAFDEKIVTGGGHVPAVRRRATQVRIMDKGFSELPVMVAGGSFPVSILGQDLLRQIGPVLIDADHLTFNPALSGKRQRS